MIIGYLLNWLNRDIPEYEVLEYWLEAVSATKKDKSDIHIPKKKTFVNRLFDKSVAGRSLQRKILSSS